MFRTKTRIPFELIGIEDDGFHLLLHATVHDQPVRLLVDTGASRTVFDKNRILQYIPDVTIRPADKASTGLGTNSMEGHLATLKSFSIGTLKLRDFEIVLLDLAHVNQSYEQIGLSAIDGVLGSDLLSEHRAVIDYGKLEITLEK